MRSISWYDSGWTKFVFICSIICSISWAKSYYYNYSLFLLCASYSNDSINCMGTVSSIYTCYTSYFTCSYCASFSLLHNCYSFLSCRFNSFYVSSILYFSPSLCVILLLCCRLLASLSKATFITSGCALNLPLCSAFALSATFLLPLSRAGMLPSVDVDHVSLWDVASIYFSNHSIAISIGWLSLKKR